MSESKELEKARSLIISNKKEEATPILWKLYDSKHLEIKLNAILSLIAILNGATQNEKLLEITKTGINIASKLNINGIHTLLLGKKGSFLLTQLGQLISRQRDLVLSASVFEWIDFSLKRDKDEFESIKLKRGGIEKEIADIESSILEIAESSKNNKFRGHIFMTLGNFYSSKFFNDQLDLLIGGKRKSKIGNVYLIRKWNLDKLILYKKESRKKIKKSKNNCFYFLKKAIYEFESGELGIDTAYAYYDIALKYKVIFSFIKANKYLNKAYALAKANNEIILLEQIDFLKKELTDKNKKYTKLSKI